MPSSASHLSSTMYLLALFIFALSTFAQNIQILSPSPNQILQGENFTVQVALPDNLSPGETISVAIGIQECGSDPCPSVDNNEILGEILFAGSYQPHRVDPVMPPYQNFTFNASNSSHATIHIAQFFLLGAGPTAILDLQNVSVRFNKHV